MRKIETAYGLTTISPAMFSRNIKDGLSRIYLCVLCIFVALCGLVR